MMTYFPYILGGILFLASAGRFCARGDLVGAAISGVAALVAVLSPLVRRKQHHLE
jgi:hypothetical protein